MIKWILKVTHKDKDSSVDFADWIKDGKILTQWVDYVNFVQLKCLTWTVYNLLGGSIFCTLDHFHLHCEFHWDFISSFNTRSFWHFLHIYFCTFIAHLFFDIFFLYLHIWQKRLHTYKKWITSNENKTREMKSTLWRPRT